MRPHHVIASLTLVGLVVISFVRWRADDTSAMRVATTRTHGVFGAESPPNAKAGYNPVAVLPPRGITRADPEYAARLERAVGYVVWFIETDSDYHAAVQVADSAGTEAQRDSLLLEIVRALRDRNLNWAANFTLTLPAGAARYAAIDIVAEGFVGRDAKGALQWAEGLPPGVTRSIALERIVGQIASTDLSRAGDYVATLRPGLAKDDAMCSLASRWAHQNPAGALAWAQTVPDGPLKPRVLASIGFELAQLEPAAALEFVERVASAADRALLRESLRWSQSPTAAKGPSVTPSPATRP